MWDMQTQCKLIDASNSFSYIQQNAHILYACMHACIFTHVAARSRRCRSYCRCRHCYEKMMIRWKINWNIFTNSLNTVVFHWYHTHTHTKMGRREKLKHEAHARKKIQTNITDDDAQFHLLCVCMNAFVLSSLLSLLFTRGMPSRLTSFRSLAGDMNSCHLVNAEMRARSGCKIFVRIQHTQLQWRYFHANLSCSNTC